ncbi:tetratricopeptide repeat protein [Palleronia sp. LCG004]|uniref:tetratricopeptide repeat protein n=1 Tax=Palleronia sp. LCG004 TaxID=3079304 RepID=UPI002943AD3E|nr:tetratricopeptide repeat protein [Palleronia sp. LCG004]WOI57686.1 tetratricopeptide repeat protein [Palleronia sp. LCG004]
MRGAASLLIALSLAAPAGAQDYGSGQEAYAARDWAAAERLWLDAAEDGSAEAFLGLGNLLDFGLTGPSRPDEAFAMYRRAARLGNAEAAFNVAVMLDSGVGAESDPRGAAGWYALSALDDFPRAQYNLGRIFAEGTGVPANPALADLWLGRAQDDVPAAGDLLQGLAPVEGAALGAPEILLVVLVEDGSGAEARLAWAAPPGPDGSRYRVEMMDAAARPAARQVQSIETEISAASLTLPDLPEDAIVRVIQMGETDYAASPWTDAEGVPVETVPPATVRFRVGQDDRRAMGYAERIGASLDRSGLDVVYDLTEDADGTSSVVYGFDSDLDLAAQIADFVPALGEGGALREGGLDLGPGEVLVRIVFETGG